MAAASHFYGADFYYTWVSGNTYKITLAVYGDCAGAAFSTLNGATPYVEIRNGSSLVGTITLAQAGNGVEVTPVCPAQASNTRCSSPTSSIPGITRYIYSANYTLGTTSANWVFRFNGNHSTTTSAGRSNSISNIAIGSTTVLEARLNNLAGPNSSVNYTTIPTPFFCINKPASYNPGAVDPNLDSLGFSLIPGLTVGGLVTYTSPYTAAAPLGVSTGTFSSSATNGQLSFTPNLVQRSLVVSQVAEYRNNVLVGTSMREMTFVVLSTCNNNPPGGKASHFSAGLDSISATGAAACASRGLISFKIDPVDSDGDKINMQVAGLPAGASLSITGNNSLAPSGAFSWDLTNVAPGAYNFFVTFTDDGCPLSSKQSLAYTVTVYGSPGLSYSLISAATCVAKAKFSMAPSGGPPPYTVSVSGGGVADTFRGLSAAVVDSLAPGTYTLSVRSSVGCPYDTTITIAPATALTLSGAGTNPGCVADSNGGITLTAANGKAPYTYAIGAGAFTASNIFNGLRAGSYLAYVKDSNGCTASAGFTLTDPQAIFATAGIARPTCNFLSDGSVTVSGYNSVLPYTYAIGAGAYGSSGHFGGLPAGQYAVHIKNGLGCKKDTLLILTDSIKISATAPFVQPLCHGDSSGSLSIQATGSGLPYTYALGAGSFGAGNTFTGLAAGAHVVHVRDSAQCYFDTTITITQPAALAISPTISGTLTCYGGSNGVIAIAAAGGAPPYAYALNSGAFGFSGTFSGLSAGIHILRVKDANGCPTDSTVSLAQPAPPAFTLAITNALCNGDTTGSAAVTSAGGTAPYQYAADARPFGTGNVLTGLGAGAHTIHLKDANGCTRDSIITITQPAALIPGYTATRPLCNGAASGIITLSGAGGIMPYAYAIGTGAFTPVAAFSGLPAATHVLHIRDANGCLKDSTITLGEPLPVSLTAAVRRARCIPLSDGQVWLLPAGGTPGYTYAEGAGSYGSSGQFNSLASGTYVFHIRDVNGCQKDTTIQVQDSLAVHANYAVTNASCFGGSDGAATIAAFGGGQPYSFAVNSGSYSTSNPVTGLPAGTYALHIKDADGCRMDTSFGIAQPAKVIPGVAITMPLCHGGSNGRIAISGSGGTPGYSFAVGSGAYSSTGGIVGGLAAGTYVVHVKDANNCIADTVVAIDQPERLVIDSLDITPAACNGGNSGSVAIYAHGGAPPYLYGRSSSAFTGNNLLSGFYAGASPVYVKDANGCITDAVANITEPGKLYFLPPTIVPPTCEGFKDGRIIVAAASGKPPYHYSMDGQPYVASGAFSSLAEGSHTLLVQDSNGCVHDTDLILTGYPPIALSLTLTPPSCNDFSNGMISLNGSGGTAPLTYKIYPRNKTNKTGIFDTLRRGSYTIMVTDSNGCRKDTTVTLTDPDLLRVSATATTNDCDGPNDGGEVKVVVDGGTAPFTYAWSTGAHTEAISGLGNGAYRVTVTDAHGCQGSSEATVGYDCCRPFIPNAFTPNGDGLNDVYRMRWRGKVSRMQFFIYNRYGARVFASYQPDLGWDGTCNGKPCDVGTYFYMVKFICGSGEDDYVEYKGDVTLVR
jgi:gliding motility-associated-like protein